MRKWCHHHSAHLDSTTYTLSSTHKIICMNISSLNFATHLSQKWWFYKKIYTIRNVFFLNFLQGLNLREIYIYRYLLKLLSWVCLYHTQRREEMPETNDVHQFCWKFKINSHKRRAASLSKIMSATGNWIYRMTEHEETQPQCIVLQDVHKNLSVNEMFSIIVNEWRDWLLHNYNVMCIKLNLK